MSFIKRLSACQRIWHVIPTVIAAAAITLTAMFPVSSKAEIDNLPVGSTLYQNEQTKAATFFRFNCPGCDITTDLPWSMLTSQPTTQWYADWKTQNPDKIYTQVKNYVYNAISKGQVPTLMVYMIPNRDCGSASVGGAPDGVQYNTWIDNFSQGLNAAFVQNSYNGLAIVMLEADALALQGHDTQDASKWGKGAYDPATLDANGNPTANSKPAADDTASTGDDGCRDYTQQYPAPAGHSLKAVPHIYMDITGPTGRIAIIKRAVRKIASAACLNSGFPVFGPGTDIPTDCPSYRSHIKVYLDAAHSAWMGWHPDQMAKRLIAGGIQDAVGFFSNASNYNDLGSITGAPQSGELAYGKAVQAQLLTQLGGTWGTYPCYEPFPGGDGLCPAPPKKQIIDVSRSARTNLTSAQSNGWPGWCDNGSAYNQYHPTLYPSAAYPIGDTPWVDALLWIKPPGETDGCFGGGKTDSSIARGVPNPRATSVDPAGTYDYADSCIFSTGSARFDADGNPIGSSSSCSVTGTDRPSDPWELAIAKEQRKADGKADDLILLEWQPSRGACLYQVGWRYSDTYDVPTGLWRFNGWSTIYSTGTKGSGATNESVSYQNGPPTWALLTGAAGTVKHGHKVIQYSVRARNCYSPAASAYTAYGTSLATVTTADFQN